MRLGARADVADRCRRGSGLLRRILCAPMGRIYGAACENGEFPEVVEDGLLEGEVMEVHGKTTCGCTAEDGVGGGASKVFARVFRVVGESVEILRDAASLFVGGDGGIAVCSESFGLLGAGGLFDGIMDNIAPATCF